MKGWQSYSSGSYRVMPNSYLLRHRSSRNVESKTHKLNFILNDENAVVIYAKHSWTLGISSSGTAGLIIRFDSVQVELNVSK